MPFCENCGNRINENDRYCENCGNSLMQKTQENVNPLFAFDSTFMLKLFSSLRWKKHWKRITQEGNCNRYGIILTNTSDCPNALKNNFFNTLESYIKFRAEHNVYYCVLDLAKHYVKPSNNSSVIRSPEYILDVLKEISQVAMPQCIMIIGDRNAIDSVKWYNPLINHGDHDEHVHSDLPYISLDTRSSFQRSEFNFGIEVGRIPSQAQNGFIEAQTYLTNVMHLRYDNRPAQTLVSTAKHWGASSKLTFKSITNKELYQCPDVSYIPGKKINHILDTNSSHNLLCFNFHGSPTHNTWVWQDEDGESTNPYEYYKPAFSPECLPTNQKNAYVICTEACYGAKPTDSNSILMTALQNRCLAYVGSSESAYGAANNKEDCLYADVLAKHFAYYIHQGWLFGSAFVKSLFETISDSTDLHGIKTITTFALYGDPTLSLSYDKANVVENRTAQDYEEYHIVVPDVKQIVETKLENVSKQISQYINFYIKNNYKYFADSTPHFYSNRNSDGYDAFVSKKTGDITSVLYVCLDAEGKVLKTYVSK